MKLSRAARLAPLTLLVALAVSQGVGCSSDDHDHEETEVPDGVVYEGAVTDEAYAAIAGLAPKTDDAKAATLTMPMDGAKVPAAQPTVLTWNASTAEAPRFPVRRDRGVPTLRAIFGERVAHAHGTPFSGTAYLLTLSGPSGKVVEVLTDKTSYTPDATVWDKLKAAKTITVKLVAAKMDNNAVTAEGGPFVGSKTASFSIE